MNKIKILSLSLLLGMAMSSCEDTLSENVNPDVAHTNEAQLSLPVVVFYAQQTVYDHSEYNVFLSQCLTTTGKSSTGSYPYKQGWEFLNINRHPQWRRHYYDLGVNINDLIESSRAINSTNYELIGRAIRLMSTQLTTDAFGDMPLDEAYLSTTPRYETQAHVYNWMFNEAEELIAMFEDDAIVNNAEYRQIDMKQDRVYGGDLNKWKGLVYAIKARLLLRNIPNINPEGKICNEIIATADKAIEAWRTGDLMYGEWFGNEPRYKFDGGADEASCPWGETEPVINGWESRENQLSTAVPSKFFVENCLGVINPGIAMTQGFWNNGNGYGADPRLMLLMVPQSGPISASNKNERVMIRYLGNNIGSGSTFKQAHYPYLFAGAYAKKDGYNPIFTMEELYFIKAEAYYWSGNKEEACRLAKEATMWNIQRHLDRFLADNAGYYPGTGNAPAATEGANETNKARFERIVNSFLNDVKEGATKACSEIGQKRYFFDETKFSLSDLMTQKWIAMYMQPEQWTDMRRYHYSNDDNKYPIDGETQPIYMALRRPYNLYAPYWIDGLSDADQKNKWIQRLNYDPQTEDIYNINEVIRVGAYKDYRWLQKPMNWALDKASAPESLTAEPAGE